MAPPGGVSARASKAVLHRKNNAFCMISLKMVEKSFGFQGVILAANVAKSYQITLFARRHCFPRGVSGGLPKKAFEQPKIACWASGAPLGLRPPPGDLFWISLVASLVLEAFWGPFWMHLSPLWSSFEAFCHLAGLIFILFST